MNETISGHQPIRSDYRRAATYKLKDFGIDGFLIDESAKSVRINHDGDALVSVDFVVTRDEAVKAIPGGKR